MHTDRVVTGIGSSPALLLLSDGRFPAGGYAHSGGLEAVAADGSVRDEPTLASFLAGRLATTGAVAAAFVAATCAAFDVAGPVIDRLEVLDREFAARTPSPALRTASRRLGRQMLRAGRTVWSNAVLEAFATAPGQGPHQPVALGAVAWSAGLCPADAALAAAYDAVLAPATAAIRLLGLDPFGVHTVVAGMAPQIAIVADSATGFAHTDPAELPAYAAPLLDVAAEHHATWEVRLFAS